MSNEFDENDGTWFGGHDNNIDTTRSPTTVIRQFLRTLVRRWPRLYIALVDDATKEERRFTAEDLDISLPRRGVLFIFRDSDMEAWLDEHGGVPMPDGEGMLSIYFRPLQPLEESEGYRLDLVTVEQPKPSNFSNWVVEEIKKAAEL